MDIEGLEAPARPHAGSSGTAGVAIGFRSGRAVYALVLLTLVYVCLGLDRAVIAIVLGPIKREFGLSDTQLGFMPLAFSLVFAIAGIPLGVIADRRSRRKVIIVCTLIFSAMTALCGVVQSYTQLLLARFGVGIGEAGCGPAAMSVISDYFPPRQRASALSIYYLATPVSMILTFAAGAQVTATYGWRTTFYVAGVASIVICVLAMLSLREPVRGAAEEPSEIDVATRRSASAVAPSTSMKEFLRFARLQRSLVHLVAGTTLSATVSAATVVWVVSFLIRSHHMSVPKAGGLVGVFFGGVSMIAVLAGGFVSDWLARRNVAYRVWLLALASLIGTPALVATLLWPSLVGMTICFGIWSFVSNIWYGPAYGLAQSLVLTRMRATLASVMYMLSSLISAGLGPQIVGMLSDRLAPAVGSDSLRYALTIIATLHLWAMVHFIRAGRTLKTDLARAASNGAC